jgi:kumamolisin
MTIHLPRFTNIFATALSILMLSIAPHPARAQTVALAGNHPNAASSLTSRASADQPLTIHVSFAPRDRAKLQALLAAQQNPKSPKFHKWLKIGEFDKRFGRTKAEVDAASRWLADQGFMITAANSLGVTATGDTAIAEATFHTTIAASPDGTIFANLTDPEIPAQLAGIIVAINGLDNTHHAVPLLHRTAIGAASLDAPTPLLASSLALDSLIGGETAPDYAGGSGTAFGPGDFYTFYDETPLLNAGTNGSGSDCIALIEDSNYLASAVTLFDTTFALPAASITNVLPDTNPGITGDEIEVLLDIEWGHAVAPDSPLRVYMGSGGNALPDAITRAVTDNACSSISISYDFCGSSVSFFSGTLDPQFSKAASQGQSVFVSAGDQGSAGLNAACGVAGTQNVSEMSADPNVTAVGGTQFVPSYVSGNDSGVVTESVWNDPAGATGGGKSVVFSKPSFQTAHTPADGKRDVPDIAYGSSPYYPGYYMVVDNGGTAALTCCIGGTSIAAPMWAGLVRLIDQGSGRAGNIDTRLYQIGPSGSSVGLRDITTANDSANHSVGSNTYNGVAGFTAVTGYDQSTGWGSADATSFVNAFPVSSGSPTPTATPSPTPTPSPSATPSTSPTPTTTPSSSPTPTATPTPTSRPLAPAISPSSLNFGTVLEGAISASHSLTVTNPRTSPANLVITSSTISSQFSIFSPTTTCTNGKSLGAGSSCTFVLRFTPTATGNINGTLSITDNASNSPQTAKLSGFGEP